MIFENRNKNLNGYCSKFPYGYVLCKNGYDCLRCTFGDDVRKDNVKRFSDVPLFTEKDARRQTLNDKGDCFWHYPVILKPETLEDLGFEKNVFFQIAIAEGGAGVFSKNPVGYLDCCLFSNPAKKFTICRHNVFGIPNSAAVRRFDEMFFLDLGKRVYSLDNRKGVWCL